MTENATKILESFDRLDPSEQHSVVVSLLRRAGELPSVPLKICSHHWTMKKMPTPIPNRGEVWLVDLGMAAKVRPCLVVSIPANEENDRVLTT